MENEGSNIFLLILFGSLLTLLMAGFIVTMVLIHRSRQIKNKQKLESLKAEFEMIFKKCTMTGEAHEQLHNYLIPLKTKIENLSVKISDENTEELKKYLKDYFDYFQ